MSFDASALKELLARMPEKDSVRGFVFNSVTARVAQRIGPEKAAGLQERVMHKRPSDFLSYPSPDFFRLLFGGVELLTPSMGDTEAMHDLGYASAEGFFSSPMGKLLLAIVGKGDPARLMSNEPTAYGTSFSFGKRVYERPRDHEIILTHTQDFLPVPYNVGALEAALASINCANTKVTAVPLEMDAARYVLTW